MYWGGRAALWDLSSEYVLTSLLPLTCSGILDNKTAQAKSPGFFFFLLPTPRPAPPQLTLLGFEWPQRLENFPLAQIHFSRSSSLSDAPVKTEYSCLALPFEEMKLLLICSLFHSTNTEHPLHARHWGCDDE